MSWAELDREACTWTVPRDRTKNKSAHIVFLAPATVTELDRLAEGSIWPSSGYVLTTNGRSSISGYSKAKRHLDDAIVAEGGVSRVLAWRVHDIRRTVATGLQRLGVRFEVTEAILNHVSGARAGVAGIYQRHDWADEKAAALTAWAEYMEDLSSGSSRGSAVTLVGDGQ